MSKFKIMVAVCTLLAGSSCAWFTPGGKTIRYIPAPADYVNVPESISLLEPVSRNIVHCYRTAFSSAESCARSFEKKNYVRFRDIPYKTANYDFLTRETNPTRRWREYERTPRW